MCCMTALVLCFQLAFWLAVERGYPSGSYAEFREEIREEGTP